LRDLFNIIKDHRHCQQKLYGLDPPAVSNFLIITLHLVSNNSQTSTKIIFD